MLVPDDILAAVRAVRDSDSSEDFERVLHFFRPSISRLVSSIQHLESIDTADLEQEASIVLWRCCHSYDDSNRASFYSYFYACASNALSGFVYKFQSPITINPHEKERTAPLRAFARSFYERCGAYPVLDDYLDAGFDKKLAERFCRLSVCIYSGAADIDEHLDLVADGSVDDDVANRQVLSALSSSIYNLDDVYFKIIKSRYFLRRTYEAIGADLGMSARAVKRLEVKALSTLRADVEPLFLC